MRKLFWLWMLLAGAASSRAGEPPMAEIVVAERYFQQTGASHAHLYLYRADGKLLRQLTSDNAGQDHDPVFAPDGTVIVFARQTDAGGTEYYSVEPRGGNLHAIPSAPDWYTSTKDAPFFTSLDEDPDAAKLIVSEPAAAQPTPAPPQPPVYRTPDGLNELVLAIDPKDEDDASDGEGHGKHYLLRNLKTGNTVALGKLPGFVGVFDLTALKSDQTQRFLLAPPLRLAFFALHLNSTDGNTVFALDLDEPRLIRLSPNFAAPIPLPGEAAFLTYTENRYVPYGDGKHTANSSYIELWNAGPVKVRLAKPKAAGVCYGASIYRPGKEPAMLRMKGTDVPEPEGKR